MIKNISGSRQLLGLLFKQHRTRVLAWLSGMIGLTWIVAVAYPRIYTNPTEIIGFGLTMENPAMKAMLGSMYPAEAFNINLVFASEMLLFTAIACAIMNISIVTSSTRMDEEEGRLEIIHSLPVGRWAYLFAAIILMLVINAVMVLVMGSGLLLIGTDGFTFNDTFLYSSIIGVTGLFFASFTAIGAQLFENSRSVSFWGYGFLLFAYIVRAIGDVQNERLSLLSPLGWTTRTSVFYEDTWLPVLVLIAAWLLLTIISLMMFHRRDKLSGVIPSRPGKQRASAYLKTTLGFVWYLEKNKIIIWTLSLFLMSATFGSILGEFDTYFTEMGFVESVLSSGASENMIEQLIIYTISIMSLFALFPVILVFLGIKGEETKGYLEHYFSRSVSRAGLFLSFWLLAVFTGILMQFSIAGGFYLTSSQVLEDSIAFETMLKMTMVYMPAMLTVLGTVALLYGIAKEATAIIWGFHFYLFVVLYLNGLLEFPKWALNLSVYYLIPEYPAENIDWKVMGILLGLAIIASTAGLVCFRRRDIISD